MLTRFEVSGFKNFDDVTVDFGSFTCIAGANGVGKSNLFDAIEFLACLGTQTFAEACASVRAGVGSTVVDLESLLSDRVLSHEDELRLAAEMIVPPRVEDDLGQVAEVTDTYLRYEVTFSAHQDERTRALLLRLETEDLRALARDDLASRYSAAAPEHARLGGFVREGRGGSPLLTTLTASGPLIQAASPGAHLGRSREVMAHKTARTVLSAMASVELPLLLAAREEMRSWRFLALEPSAMRAPDQMMETRSITESGRHVPAALAYDDAEGSPVRRVRQELRELVDVRDLRVVEDPVRQTLELRARIGDTPELPARSLSDGTLRFLTLAALGASDAPIGLLAMEEPENGIHPSKIHAMVALLKRLSEPTGVRLRQVVINSHSPYIVEDVQRESAGDILLAVPWRRLQDGRRVSTTSFHPLTGTWRAEQWERSKAGRKRGRSGSPVSRLELSAFLHNPAALKDRS